MINRDFSAGFEQFKALKRRLGPRDPIQAVPEVVIENNLDPAHRPANPEPADSKPMHWMCVLAWVGGLCIVGVMVWFLCVPASTGSGRITKIHRAVRRSVGATETEQSTAARLCSSPWIRYGGTATVIGSLVAAAVAYSPADTRKGSSLVFRDNSKASSSGWWYAIGCYAIYESAVNAVMYAFNLSWLEYLSPLRLLKRVVSRDSSEKCRGAQQNPPKPAVDDRVANFHEDKNRAAMNKGKSHDVHHELSKGEGDFRARNGGGTGSRSWYERYLPTWKSFKEMLSLKTVAIVGSVVLCSLFCWVFLKSDPVSASHTEPRFEGGTINDGDESVNPDDAGEVPGSSNSEAGTQQEPNEDDASELPTETQPVYTWNLRNSLTAPEQKNYDECIVSKGAFPWSWFPKSEDQYNCFSETKCRTKFWNNDEDYRGCVYRTNNFMSCQVPS